ncbi:MAG TPA: hypothetical protein VFC29_17095 [Candidatus Limnocylindrales bacterium]|nr:hypothetical protein [Candidatus Limnocylindrales bacterium]
MKFDLKVVRDLLAAEPIFTRSDAVKLEPDEALEDEPEDAEEEALEEV